MLHYQYRSTLELARLKWRNGTNGILGRLWNRLRYDAKYKTTDELPEMARNPGRVIPAGMVNLNYLWLVLGERLGILNYRWIVGLCP